MLRGLKRAIKYRYIDRLIEEIALGVHGKLAAANGLPLGFRFAPAINGSAAAVPGKLDEEHVVWAYRVILGREPESEATIEVQRGVGDLRRLMYNLLESQEFRDRAWYECGKLNFQQDIDRPRYVLTELENGARFWVNLRDHYVSRGILNGMWEIVETTFVRRTVKPGMGAVDIGANLGWFTVELSRLVGSEGRVAAFEPRDDIHRWLARTVAENRLDNVLLHPVALGAENGETRMQWHRSDENPGGTHVSTLPIELQAKHPDYVYQPAPVRVLDEMVGYKVDFIKIDVEGAEKLVFDGARRILTEDRPIILSEMAPASLAGISAIGIVDYFTYLAGCGYGVHELEHDGSLGRRLDDWPYDDRRPIVNVVLVPSERADIA